MAHLQKHTHLIALLPLQGPCGFLKTKGFPASLSLNVLLSNGTLDLDPSEGLEQLGNTGRMRQICDGLLEVPATPIFLKNPC